MFAEPFLTGARVTLRLAQSADAAALARFYRENNSFFGLTQTPKPEAWCEEVSWPELARGLRNDFVQDRACQLFAFTSDGRAVAAVGLTAIVRGAFQACYLGYLLAEDAQGRGLMHETLALAIPYAFTELNLHRIMANYAPTNLKSGNVLRRLGFRIEGYAERYLRINGVWTDHFLTSLTHDGWRAPQAHT